MPLPAGQHRTDGRLYVGSVAADIDLEALGLLDGLEGEARTERAELIAWLLDRGFSIDQIRASVAPLLLPANRVMGEDGVYLSAREICEETGLDLPLLQRLQGAVGLPRIEDPDAAVLPRVDGEAVAHAKIFLDMGVDPDETVAVMRVLMEGLQHAAAMMRRAAFRTLMRPGASEIDLAGASEALARQAVPQVGPMVQDLLLLELRHTFETEAVNAAERAAGTLPGARKIAVAFADLAELHPSWRGVTAARARTRRQPARRPCSRRCGQSGAVHQDDRRRCHAGVRRPGSAVERRP